MLIARVNVRPLRPVPHLGFQSQLHVEWLTRTNTRRSIVVADSVGACTKSAEEVAVRRRKVQAVEDIEHFHADLSLHSLGHRNVLEYRQVHRSIKPGPVN